MENNNLLYAEKIEDFTGWGYGVFSCYRFEDIRIIRSKNDYFPCNYKDSNNRYIIPNRGLCGWGANPVDAYLKAIQTEKDNKDYNNEQYFIDSVNSFVFYRISPRAKKYLDTYGYHDDNRGYTNIIIIKVPYTKDENGYPVRYIIDLIDDEFRKKIDYFLSQSENERMEVKNYCEKHGKLIKHNISPVNHNMERVTITKNVNDNNNLWNYAAMDSEKNKIYGLGSTPERAFMDGIENFNKLFAKYQEFPEIESWIIDSRKVDKDNFELFFKIVPLSKMAKKYINAFGFTNYPDYNTKNNDSESKRGYRELYIKNYSFREQAVRIPPVILENGYPADLIFDVVDNKTLKMLDAFDKIAI